MSAYTPKTSERVVLGWWWVWEMCLSHRAHTCARTSVMKLCSARAVCVRIACGAGILSVYVCVVAVRSEFKDNQYRAPAEVDTAVMYVGCEDGICTLEHPLVTRSDPIRPKPFCFTASVFITDNETHFRPAAALESEIYLYTHTLFTHLVAHPPSLRPFVCTAIRKSHKRKLLHKHKH